MHDIRFDVASIRDNEDGIEEEITDDQIEQAVSDFFAASHFRREADHLFDTVCQARSAIVEHARSLALAAQGEVLDDGPEDEPCDRYPVSDWKYEVANGDTSLGYETWLDHKIEAEREDHT